MRLASVTQLKKKEEDKKSHSKHDMTLHPNHKLEFKMQVCGCGGILLKYVINREMPQQMRDMVKQMTGQEVIGVQEEDILVRHVHIKWWDFIVGGINAKVNIRLWLMKRYIRKQNRSAIIAESVRAVLEA